MGTQYSYVRFFRFSLAEDEEVRAHGFTLYFPKKNDNIICSFGNNIYDLYNELQEYDSDGDIVALMRERLADRGDTTLDGIRNSDISEIFFFFDYDC